jgi:hypothetical protein
MQKAWEQLPWWSVPTVDWIPGDSGHGRAWGAGQKKEDDEGIQFHLLPMVERHRGGGNLAGKKAAAHCSSCVPSGGAAHQGTRRTVQEETGRGRWHCSRGERCGCMGCCCRGRAGGGGALHPGGGRQSRPRRGCCSDSWRCLMSRAGRHSWWRRTGAGRRQLGRRCSWWRASRRACGGRRVLLQGAMGAFAQPLLAVLGWATQGGAEPRASRAGGRCKAEGRDMQEGVLSIFIGARGLAVRGTYAKQA